MSIAALTIAGCGGSRKLKTLDNADGAWYGTSALGKDTVSELRIYSSEKTFNAFESNSCPRKRTIVDVGYIVLAVADYACEGGEPPKGKAVSRLDIKYELTGYGRSRYLSFTAKNRFHRYEIVRVIRSRRFGTIIDFKRVD